MTDKHFTANKDWAKGRIANAPPFPKKKPRVRGGRYLNFRSICVHDN
jgi:hypothetical protein